MNLIEFSNILHHPREVSVPQINELEDLLEEYPYFQAAHFLHLNGLKNIDSFKYNNSLKKTAAYTTDRAVLFDFITSGTYNFQTKTEDKTEIKKETEVSITEEEKVEILPEAHNKSEESVELPIGKPLQFDASEDYSFNEWLQISSLKPIQRNQDQNTNENLANPIQNPSQFSKRNFDLIEKFIASSPKFSPHNSLVNSNIATESIIENENLMTETLAHVYLEQKKFQKAITAFTVLSLKYPEKSSFFANRIKEIQKLQEK